MGSCERRDQAKNTNGMLQMMGASRLEADKKEIKYCVWKK